MYDFGLNVIMKAKSLIISITFSHRSKRNSIRPVHGLYTACNNGSIKREIFAKFFGFLTCNLNLIVFFRVARILFYSQQQ